MPNRAGPHFASKMDSVAAFSPREVDARVFDLLGRYPPDLFTEKLHCSVELIRRYTLELAALVLERLGASQHLGSWRTKDELCELCAVDPAFRPALEWLLDSAVELGWIETASCAARPSRSYRSRQPTWDFDLPRLRDVALAIDNGNAATLNLLDHAASAYPAVARGKVSGERALLEPEHIELWLAYFDNANPTYTVNNWTAGCAALWRAGNRPRLRILEIGAGSGSGTHVLLRLLEEQGLSERIERYVVSEPGAFFLRRAQRELRRRYPTLPLEFQPLDIDRAWSTQGIAGSSFDLVYGINVMHVAQDLAYSLGQAWEALTDGGWLVLGECLQSVPRKPIYPELIFQLLASYNNVRLDPEYRPTAGFLAPCEWTRALARAGFKATVEPDVERIRAMGPHFLAGAVCGEK